MVFLDHLAREGSVLAACAAAGVSRQSAYVARRRDHAFARGWDAALVLAREHVADVLASRALHGVEEDVFYHGERIATRRRFDTRLLLAHLARLDNLADATAAGEDAARFDELVAIVGGVRPAEDLFDIYLPLVRHEVQPAIGLALRKEVLFRRGAIKSPRQRMPGSSLTANDRSELDGLIARLERRLALGGVGRKAAE